ncbi:MAG TPA: hypothetical protein EYH34_11455 [Planctomycetes bacterium]|nr:hypothetical protein [Planctomycetota bacterium]
MTVPGRIRSNGCTRQSTWLGSFGSRGAGSSRAVRTTPTISVTITAKQVNTRATNRVERRLFRNLRKKNNIGRMRRSSGRVKRRWLFRRRVRPDWPDQAAGDLVPQLLVVQGVKAMLCHLLATGHWATDNRRKRCPFVAAEHEPDQSMSRDRVGGARAVRCNSCSAPPGPPGHLTSLVDVARWRAMHQSDEPLYIYLKDGERESGQLTFGQLDRRARAIAAELQARGAVGERVLLLFPPGLEFNAAIFGCLYAGAVAVPAYPPDPLRLDRTLPRLKAILRDAQARLVFGTEELLRLVRGPLAPLGAAEVVALEAMRHDRPSQWTPVDGGPDRLCLLQYTSGSTGNPRGVILTHRNLMHNLWTMHLQDSDGVVGVIWVPPYHDLGLIGGVFLPLYSGRRIVVIPPVAFLQQPVRWLRAISRYRVKTAGAPTFGYELCVRKFRPDGDGQLDLSSWSIAVVGAEPVRAEAIERFVRTFEPYGFHPETFMPAYGLAEAVLHVTGGQRGEGYVIRSFSGRALERHRVEEVPPDDSDARRLVGCGRPVPGERVVIVDPRSRRPVAPGGVGEIWVQSPSVAQGYWNRPRQTERIFRARLAGEANGHYLRTGDLGFFHEGQLFVAGRLKELIILGGRNFYPQDIELTVRNSHPALRSGSGAAFSCVMEGREQLVVVHECRGSSRFRLEDVVAKIRRELATEYLLTPYAILLIPGGTLPRTSSGKIRRRACRGMFLAGRLKVLIEWRAEGWEPALAGAADDSSPTARRVAPRTPLEEKIAAVWADVLGVDRVGVEDNFFQLGGHSLLVTQLYFRLSDLLPIDLPLERLLEQPTVAGLAKLILAARLEQDAALAERLQQLEAMSEVEAERLLRVRGAPAGGGASGPRTLQVASALQSGPGGSGSDSDDGDGDGAEA